ncbi:hypothetical protein INN71_02075 [Nocardioides sp. ChNu-153]|uniref:hypothetical protein n=1 Tax=unclassified Nocardioides TaxID=2615069 RepID=UPI002406DF29|nr:MULTISPECIES: hypothetical protein [unclassified Nocardioides]MDF9714700.1 hypothetical protein [Nocardioides sp. ChNu-99]MDN7120171.1 hypothetical protein [Nocardioides sp. ChNu-153]
MDGRDERHLSRLRAIAAVTAAPHRYWDLISAVRTLDEAVVALQETYDLGEEEAQAVLALQGRNFVESEVQKVREALGGQPGTYPEPPVVPPSDEPHEVASSRVCDARGDVPPEPPHLAPDRVGDLVHYARAQAEWLRHEQREARSRNLPHEGGDEAIATWETVALALAEAFDLVDLLPGEDEVRGFEGR